MYFTSSSASSVSSKLVLSIGFATNQFSLGNDENVGNRVILVPEYGSNEEFICDPFTDGSNEEMIQCYTP